MDMIKLRAKAKTLGIDGYKGMSVSELQEAIKKSEGKSGKSGATAAKKSSTNGTKSGRKTAVKTAVKKATAKVTKKSGRKTASAKSQPATAKRATTGAKRSSNVKPATRSRQKVGDAGRNIIDNSQIDWTAESGVGASEPRKTIMKWLRKFHGDVQKVYDKLEDDVATLYKSNKRTGEKYTQAKRKELLRWHISRVKFDFVMDTEQHDKSTNRTNASSGAKSAPVKSSAKSAVEVGIKDFSDQKLARIVNAAAGKRGRKSAAVLAAIKERERRQKTKAKAAGGSTATKKATGAKKSTPKRAGRKTAPVKAQKSATARGRKR
jgi:hypothetical protein